MKKIFDKIILGILIILCLISFFVFIAEFPKMLNTYFNTNFFNTGILFIFCIFIIGYSINVIKNQLDEDKEKYYQLRKEKEEKILNHFKEDK